MASTFFGLTIGSSGLFASKSGLNTTAHNIANIETEGYSRQVIRQRADKALNTNNRYGMLGTGVSVVSTDQMRSKYYDEKFRSNTGIGGLYEERYYFMKEIESYLNEIELQGFTTSFDNMYNSLQELSKNPESLTVRTQVTNYAASMCDYFNSLHTNLVEIQNSCNYEIKNQVYRINSLASQIAVLTKQVNTVEVGGENANDLRDQRNLLVDELSKIVNVSVIEQEMGDAGMKTYVVRIDGNTLVDTYETFELSVKPRDELHNQCDMDGLYDIYWYNGEQLKPASATMTGSLKALFEVRDGDNEEALKGRSARIVEGEAEVTITNTNVNDVAKLNIPSQGRIIIGHGEYTYESFEAKVDDEGNYSYTFKLDKPVHKTYPDDTEISVGSDVDYKGIPYYMSQINQFIRTFSEAFNTIHRQGENLYGDEDNHFFTGYNLVTGEDYILGNFNPTVNADVTFITSDQREELTSYYMLTAQNFKISQKIIDDPSMIATTKCIADGVGANDIVEKLINLKKDTSMFKQGNPAQFLQTLVSDVGIDTKSAKSFSENQDRIIAEVENQRLSVSGVDQDEETMSLIKYQEAYNLNSKVISVMNEIYNKLINETGV